MQKKSVIIIVVVTLIILVGVALGGFYFHKKVLGKNNKKKVRFATTESESESESKRKQPIKPPPASVLWYAPQTPCKCGIPMKDHHQVYHEFVPYIDNPPGQICALCKLSWRDHQLVNHTFRASDWQ